MLSEVTNKKKMIMLSEAKNYLSSSLTVYCWNGVFGQKLCK